MRRNRESISIPWSPWLVLVWPIRWRSQSSSQDQPQPHFALAELLITGHHHQSGGGEAQSGPSSLHFWSSSSLMAAWLETRQSPTCCPAPWLPHSAEARSKKKLSLEAIYLPQWAPKLTQNRFCGLMNSIQTVGRQCLWSFIIYLLLIVQDIFENYYFNKRELNEPTYFSYDRHGKNSLLLWGEISHAHILNSQSPVSGLQTDLFYCSISFCEQVATVPGCIYFIQLAAMHYWYTILKSSPTRELCCEYSILSLLLAN